MPLRRIPATGIARDPFTLKAAQEFKRRPEDVTKEQRYFAKTVTHGARYSVGLEAFLKQAVEVERLHAEFFSELAQEINCWRMFGIRVEWCMDSLVVDAP